MSERLSYDVAVVGGGPAGLTTALYTTRLGHRTALFEKEGGRHAAVSHVHNLLGVSEDVSGAQLAELATEQLEEYGGDVYPDDVDAIARVADEDGHEVADDHTGDRDENRFRVRATHSNVLADRVVFATGFSDNPPEVPGLRRFTGRGLHYCLHCDAYTLGDGSVFVLGHGEHAAQVAMTMLNFTDDVDLLLDAREPEWDDETDRLLEAHPIDRIDAHVVSAYAADDGGENEDNEPWLGGFEFGDGTERDYTGGFAMYGREYNAGLAADLGCALTEDGAIDVDENRETSVDGAYAVGDVTHGQNQTTIAIGDAAYAGIAIHKDLRRYPLSIDDLDGGSEPTIPDDLAVPAAAADLRARMRRVRELERHAGLRDPRPGR